MRGLPFPTDAPYPREGSHDFGTPSPMPNLVPIDPSLTGPFVDPSFLGAEIVGYASELPPTAGIWSPNQPSALQKYSQGPQGDPFAPQPLALFFPSPQDPELPPVKTAKRRRKPRREEECSFCRGDDGKNKMGEREQMVTCHECGRSGHPSCTGLQPTIGPVLQSYPWKCIECKICEICEEKGDDERILFCDHCDRGWHMDCLRPPLETNPPGDWNCPLCPPLPGPHYQEEAELHDVDMDIDPALQIDIDPALRESSVASSSRPTTVRGRGRVKGKGRSKGRGKGRLQASVHEVDADDEEDMQADEEPVSPTSYKGKGKAIANGNTNPRHRGKGKGPARSASATPSFPDDVPPQSPPPRPQKRPRFRISSPGPSKDVSSSPPRVVVRLRLPGKGKGKKARDDDDEEDRRGLFDEILSSEDRDTSKTGVLSSDKDRFERSRAAAEEKLIPPPTAPAPVDLAALLSAPGPSTRPLRSTVHQLQALRIPSTPRPPSPSPSTPGPSSARSKPGHDHDPPTLRIRLVRFGVFDIQTWYDAPFPEEFSNIPEGRLWMCEFCLKYMKSRFGAQRHRMKCKSRHPPGDEIYRDGTISIFEVDGRKNKIYCQNLCLLSKMFLDNKSLFYDVEPFLFYVMTEVDETGARFIGYFSKEKCSPKDYNVSCIMTLPVRQRRGWGNLLIDFSYLLSKKEQRTGTPERPLSGLGAIGYKKYWTLAIMRYLQTAPPNPRLEDISVATSMTLEDIHVTLSHLGMIFLKATTPPPLRPSPGHSIKTTRGRKNGIARRHLQRTQPNDPEVDSSGSKTPVQLPTDYEVRWEVERVERYLAEWEQKGYLKLKPERLNWTPFLLARSMPTPLVENGTADETSELPVVVDVCKTSEVDDLGLFSDLVASPVQQTPAPASQETPGPFGGLEQLANLALLDAQSASNRRNVSSDVEALPSAGAAQLARDEALAQELANSPMEFARSLRSRSSRVASSPTRSNSSASLGQSKMPHRLRSQSSQPPPTPAIPLKTSPRKRRRADSTEAEPCHQILDSPARIQPPPANVSGAVPPRRQSMRLMNGDPCDSAKPPVTGIRMSSRLNGAPTTPAALGKAVTKKADLRGAVAIGKLKERNDPPAERESAMDRPSVETEDREISAPAAIGTQSASSDDTVCPTPDAITTHDLGNVASSTVSPAIFPREIEDCASVKKTTGAFTVAVSDVVGMEDPDADAEGEDDIDAEGEPDTEIEG